MRKTTPDRTPIQKLRTPAGIVLLYAAFAALWIAVSDQVLVLFFRDPELLQKVNTFKGMLFIAITGTLLYLLLKAWYGFLTRATTEAIHYRDRLERAFKGANDGWWDWDLKNNEFYYSPRCWDMLGYAVDELPADRRLWRRVMHPDDQGLADRILAEALKSGTDSFAIEARLRHNDRRYIPTLLRYSVQRDDDGKPVRISGTTMDISAQKNGETALREREKHFRTIFDGINDAIVLHDADGVIVDINARMISMYGYRRDELLGMNVAALSASASPVTHTEAADWMANTQRDEMPVFEWLSRKSDGTPLWTEISMRPTDVGGNPHILLVVRDIGERKRADERLHQAAAVFETTREGVMVTGVDKRIIMVNHAFCDISGYTEAEVIGQSPAILSSGRHAKNFYLEMWDRIAAVGHWQGEIWNRRKNGDVYPELLSISAVKDSAGLVTNYVGVFADISHIKASETKLEFLAHHDPLTQLPNRLLLLSRLEHGIDTARREHTQLALLMLDLDRFKDVNDSYGHGAGDELLQQVAERLRSRLRGVDTVARLGGDEFTVVLEKIAMPENAAHIAREIIDILSQPWWLSNGVEVRIGTSIGIALFPEHGASTKELLQHADAAMYQAKSDGRGCFRYFSENLTYAARERIDMEARLHRAIGRGELRVFYQPQVDIETGRIIGAEALVRWQDPLEGLIPPARFIPVAEATGLISELGEWVLLETCSQGQRWIEAGLPPLRLAVNLSLRQFLYSDIGAVVSKVLAATGFPAMHLELELTESALMERAHDAVQLLTRLRTLGVRLAIDDFGTGYSSLAHLKRFPLDVLKIDKSFIDDIPQHRDDMEITAAIVAMGHNMGFEILAEGVETTEQLAFLQAKGCDMYQGYLTSPAVPAAEFEQLLETVNAGRPLHASLGAGEDRSRL
jgi:diguanylate cyclase (GGDEF)-like protein/PAS domain S-box-containing protein